jgi:hypothetical protein
MVVTICAAGTLLLSMLIYKGQPNGRNATKEFPSGIYPPNHFYRCQPAAWMDETVMILLVNKVLVPYVVTTPDHIVPIIILDMYQCQHDGIGSPNDPGAQGGGFSVTLPNSPSYPVSMVDISLHSPKDTCNEDLMAKLLGCGTAYQQLPWSPTSEIPWTRWKLLCREE